MSTAVSGTFRNSEKVPAKLVVTFKPGREMQQRIGKLKKVPGEGQ